MDDFISFPQKGKLNVEIGNCVEIMKRYRDEGVLFDAITTDPPYAINLHSKSWDTGDLVFNKEFWTLCYDILKPGGFLIAFAAGRKYHRVAVAVEDAGFTMYPPLQWQFPGGLPKPANLSELFDRDNVKDRKVLGTKTGSGFTSANEKHGAQARIIGEIPTRPMPNHAFAIRAQQGDIDAVHRCAAHQPDCRFDLAHLPLPCNLESCLP